MDATDHQRNVRKAMEGNIAAYFHPSDELIAFLYPNAKINIYNSQTFENVKSKTVRRVDPTTGDYRSNEELVAAADMSMAADGFEREGRVQEARF
jgi:hypothetical protein